jgi:subtilisin-like proprotein convertase family protein
MKTLATGIFILLLFNFNMMSFGQEFSIDGADIFQCGVWLRDDGLSVNDYSVNRMDTISICPEFPDTIVNLYFSEFDLGVGDYLMVYDGNSTNAQLLGIYQSLDLLEQHVSSANANGCVTLVFVSDSTDTGNLAAYISCGTLCTLPLVDIISDEESPMLVCPGEEIIFDGSATILSDQSGIQSHLWDFGDGNTDTFNWPVVNHVFNEPGVYSVQLIVSDSLGCSNGYAPNFLVKVSTYPDFSLLSQDFSICAPGQVYLGLSSDISDSLVSNTNMNSWLSHTIFGNSDADFGYPLYIANTQKCLNHSITYSSYGEDEMIATMDDIGNIWVNMEHSFIGDLIIELTCPNGNSVMLSNQPSSGAFLGEPIDDGLSPGPGIGYDYFWTSYSTNGTWNDASIGLSTLPSDDYESLESMSNLIGCPLNGTWTITICDIWGADDGYLFSWGVNFNPPYVSDSLEISPVYGANCDSSYWTGPNIIQQTSGCDFILADIIDEGVYEYTYTVINDYGCSFDTTVAVQLVLSTPVSAGEDLFYECQPLLLEGAVQGSNTECSESNGFYSHCFGQYEQWDITYCPDSIGNGSMMSITLMSAEFLDGYTFFVVYDGANTAAPDMAIIENDSQYQGTYTATNLSGCLTIQFYQNAFTSCDEGFLDSLTYYISCVAPEEIPYQFQWSPEIGLSNPDHSVTMLSGIESDTTYILQGFPIGHPECVTSDTLDVVVNCVLPGVAEQFSPLTFVKTTLLNHEIFIQFNHLFDGEISLFDLSGREVQKLNCRASETSMDCSSLADGCYVLHFKSQMDGLYSRKLVITQ